MVVSRVETLEALGGRAFPAAGRNTSTNAAAMRCALQESTLTAARPRTSEPTRPPRPRPCRPIRPVTMAALNSPHVVRLSVATSPMMLPITCAALVSYGVSWVHSLPAVGRPSMTLRHINAAQEPSSVRAPKPPKEGCNGLNITAFSGVKQLGGGGGDIQGVVLTLFYTNCYDVANNYDFCIVP